MPVFVSLGRFTKHGREELAAGRITSGWQRAEAAMNHYGGRVLAAYSLFGKYDTVAISEWPDEQSYLRAVGSLFKKDVMVLETALAVPIDQLGPQMSSP